MEIIDGEEYFEEDDEEKPKRVKKSSSETVKKTSTKKKKTKNIPTTEEKPDNTLLVGFVIVLIIMIGIGFFIFTPHKKDKKAQKVQAVAKVERKASKSPFSALNIQPKESLLQSNKKFHFTIERDIYFSGDMSNIKLKIKLPEDIPNRQKIFNLSVSPKPQKIENKNGEKDAIIYFSSNPDKIKIYCTANNAITVEFSEAIDANKKITFNVKDYWNTMLMLLIVFFVAIYLNSILYTPKFVLNEEKGVLEASEYLPINFMYVVNPPVDGVPFLNKDHGWLVYIIHYMFLAFTAVTLCFIKPVINWFKEHKNSKQQEA